MVVNNRPSQLDQKIDQAIQGAAIKSIDFDNYNLSEMNLEINNMYNTKLNDFLFFRKSVDALFVDAKSFYRILFFFHLVYTTLLIIPIFYPDSNWRMILSWLCFSISFCFASLEVTSMYHDY